MLQMLWNTFLSSQITTSVRTVMKADLFLLCFIRESLGTVDIFPKNRPSDIKVALLS